MLDIIKELKPPTIILTVIGTTMKEVVNSARKSIDVFIKEEFENKNAIYHFTEFRRITQTTWEVYVDILILQLEKPKKPRKSSKQGKKKEAPFIKRYVAKGVTSFEIHRRR